MIIVASTFTKVFPVHTKTRSCRFQIPQVWRAFSTSSVNRTNKASFICPAWCGDIIHGRTHL